MTCPICQKESVERYSPFCSKRCSDVDLGRWMTGRYAVPASDPEDLKEAAEALSKVTPKPH
jgi:endogenous inhibitor of DNA gyrase (YacG/DUF329 family)